MNSVSTFSLGMGMRAFSSNGASGYDGIHKKGTWRRWVILAIAIILSPIAFAQNTPQVTGVDPNSGKVNDTVTVAGTNLDKTAVSAVFLSDEKNDYKATVVDQTGEKIVIKIPEVKSGGYNISIQVGDKLFIKPVKFTVQ
jgi:hypothetical protein